MDRLVKLRVKPIVCLYRKFMRVKSIIAGWIIGATVPLFKYINPPTYWPYTLQEQRNLPLGSLGKEIANTLDRQGYEIIPKFEHHDAEHVLFGYKMTGIGELRLQFFLLGNGRLGWVAIASVLLGVVWFPELVWLFLRDYKRGKEFKNINTVNLGNYLPEPTEKVRNFLRK